MAGGGRGGSDARGPAGPRPSGPAGLVVWARERTNAAILPLARAVGLLGLLALAACGGLLAVPEGSRPVAVDDDRLAFLSMLALALASLLGWGCMQLGLARLRGAVGWRVGGYLFVLAPLLCATAGLVVGQTDLVHPASLPGHATWWPVVRFYPPVVVVTAIAAFVTSRAAEGEGAGRVARGGWALVSVAPYALLIAVLAFGVRVDWVSDSLEDTLDELGSWALVLQLVLAFFVGGGPT